MKPATQRHIAAQKRIRELLVAGLSNLWRELGSYDESDVARFLGPAVPLVHAAQRTSVAVTDGYLAAALGRRPLGVNPDRVISKLRNGVPAEEVYQRPFVNVWSALKQGQQWQDAVQTGLGRLQSSAAMDVQLAMRETADQVDQQDPNTFGYERVADAGACDFCQEVDGAYVKASDGFAMALHNNCGCSLEPLEEPHPRAVRLPDGTEVRAYQYGPLNENVAVENHGELGPVLTDPANNFTSENQI